jgi:exosortase/archaeosortase family protein
MASKLLGNLKIFFQEPQWAKVRAVFWFFIITLAFQIVWRIWANTFHFAPITHFIFSVRIFLVDQLYNMSTFILRDILNVTLTAEPPVIITKNGVRLILDESAAGFKQMCQFAILILLFSGQWKRKAWFIPLGIVILHLTNILRIISLVVIAMHWPQQIHYAHDSYLRIIYYVVIFGLWLVWVEKIASKNQDIKPR